MWVCVSELQCARVSGIYKDEDVGVAEGGLRQVELCDVTRSGLARG